MTCSSWPRTQRETHTSMGVTATGLPPDVALRLEGGGKVAPTWLLRLRSGPLMRFHDYTITADGALYSSRVQDTSAIEPLALAVFEELPHDSVKVLIPLPWPGPRRITLDWFPLGTAAVARFRVAGELATVCALVSGRDPQVDAGALAELERPVSEFCQAAGLPPGRGILEASGRPALLALVVPTLRPELPIIADMETCLAAAFFLRVLREPHGAGESRAA